MLRDRRSAEREVRKTDTIESAIVIAIAAKTALVGITIAPATIIDGIHRDPVSARVHAIANHDIAIKRVTEVNARVTLTIAGTSRRAHINVGTDMTKKTNNWLQRRSHPKIPMP